MNIAEYSVKNPVVSWLLVVILAGGGIWGFEKMGKLEDPAFTIKEAKVITFYPGASAQQVQDEVTYHIEDALQRTDGSVELLELVFVQPRQLGVALLGLGLGACTVGPEYVAPETPALPDWSLAPAEGLSEAPHDLVLWWRVFDDPILDDLVDSARRNNNTLELAGLRVQRHATSRLDDSVAASAARKSPSSPRPASRCTAYFSWRRSKVR